MSRTVVAGIVEATCACCTPARELLHHVQLGPARMLCPETSRTYLDRGDGVYQSDGEALAADLLSDRPARTQEKTRISLERATFA